MIIDAGRLDALRNILKQLLRRDDCEGHLSIDAMAEELARRWFEDRTARREITARFKKFQLDETSIEAEAFRLRSEDLERIDRMIALDEARLERSLRFVADYREALGNLLRKATEQVLDEVPYLVQSSSNTSVSNG